MSQRARVLIIDDDPLFRSLIASMLRRDYLIFVAGEGSEGFHKALEHPPDIVIIDIQMPGWDGIRTLKSFREHPSLRTVRTMMLTADASKETVLAAIQLGADDYLIKTSFSRESLLEKLARLARRLDEAAVDHEPKPAAATPAPAPQPVMTAKTVRPQSGAPIAGPAAPEVDDEARLQELIDEWE